MKNLNFHTILCGVSLFLVFYYLLCINIVFAKSLADVFSDDVVAISVITTDKNGNLDCRNGSGMLLNDSGWLLTAAHVVQFNNQNSKIEILGTVGEASDYCIEDEANPVAMRFEIVETFSSQDFTILKHVSNSSNVVKFETSLKCVAVGDFPNGTPVTSIGFEYSTGPSVVMGFLENIDLPGGNGKRKIKIATNSGRSGSPVFDENGVVLGILVSEIAQASEFSIFVPSTLFINSLIHLLDEPLLVDSSKANSSACLDSNGSFEVIIKYSVPRVERETAIQRTGRQGVSTGSLVETKCQKFRTSARVGWNIDPSTIRIVSRIAKGSSRASVISSNAAGFTVEYCARSQISGISKKTGDSFGVAQYTEYRDIKVDDWSTQSRTSGLVDDGVYFTLPPNIRRNSLSGLTRSETHDDIEFTGPGTYGDYEVTLSEKSGFLEVVRRGD